MKDKTSTKTRSYPNSAFNIDGFYKKQIKSLFGYRHRIDTHPKIRLIERMNYILKHTCTNTSLRSISPVSVGIWAFHSESKQRGFAGWLLAGLIRMSTALINQNDMGVRSAFVFTIFVPFNAFDVPARHLNIFMCYCLLGDKLPPRLWWFHISLYKDFQSVRFLFLRTSLVP